MNRQRYYEMIQTELHPEKTGVQNVADYAKKVMEFFESHDPTHHSHLSFRSFNDILDTSPTEHPQLAAALLYLSNRIPLLELRFELCYETEDGSKFVQIPFQAVNEASKTNLLINPDTGESVEDYKSKITVYYEPTQLAQTLYAAH